MEQNRQFSLMQNAARQKLEGADPVHLAELTGFLWNGTAFEAQTLGTPIQITWPDCQIIPALEPWHALTILQYLANTKGTAPTGKFVSLSEFRSGGLARGTSFDRENDRIISRIGAFSAETIREAALRLGGVEVTEKSDLTFCFSFLPRVPVKLHLWLADEDFPASGKVLFDASADTDLQVEAAGTAAGLLLTMLDDKGTSKNYPFGFWPDLLLQQCALKSPQYIQYSGLSNTFVETKSLDQNLKK